MNASANTTSSHSYVPVAMTILGWPVLAQKGLDGHIN